jgi:hypothetical protein
MHHIVLLGDSIFDNAAYVAGGLVVRAQLQEHLAHDWRVTLLAVDGHRTVDVAGQLRQLPGDASHLVVSVGGNDALDHLNFLSASAYSVADVLGRLGAIAEAFEHAFHQMVQAVKHHRLPNVLCTIYYSRFPEQAWQRMAITALTIFNDVIIREAIKAGVPLLNVRLTCDADGAMRIQLSRR